MPELHAVFGYTIYGDRIRISHYGEWGDIIERWDLVDQMLRMNLFPILRWVCVRSWTDPDWNLSRYRTLDTVSQSLIADPLTK